MSIFCQRVLLLTLLFSGICGAEVVRADPASLSEAEIESMSPDLLAHLALVDSLYYRYDPWFALFEKKIGQLEKSEVSLENCIRLMKFYFAYAGLLGELSHTLAFTSKYKRDEVETEFIHYSRRAKETASQVLDWPQASSRQRAAAYLFRGGAEGYIGIFEYGKGNILSALINGFQADNHLEEALLLNPDQIDAHFGLGVYRYGNSRIGGLSNFIMQGGKDMRQVGIDHLEHAISSDSLTMPLALKTLAWFYVSEEINPANVDLPADQPLSRKNCRKRARELFDELESLYFKNPPPGFRGNKEVALMKAVQLVLDGDFQNARHEFSRVLEVTAYLKNEKGFKINPQLSETVEAAIQFCDLMLLEPVAQNGGKQAVCSKIESQIAFINGGGAMIEYDSKKIRRELHGVFADALNGLFKKHRCGTSP